MTAVLLALLVAALPMLFSGMFVQQAKAPTDQSNTTGDPWTSFTMPASDDYSCVYSSGYVYCQGINHAYYSELSSSGPVSWIANSVSYPITLNWGPACVQTSGYMTCVGGSTSSGAVYSSALSTGFGSWTSTTAYPTSIQEDACVQYAGYIYCVAGYSTSVDTTSSFYASLMNGVVGTWTLTTPFPVADDQLSCFVSVVGSTPYITCIGGVNITNGITTYYATISSSGIGPWSSGTVPSAAPSYPVYHIADVGCIGNTTITYCIGGSTSGASANLHMATYVTNPTVGFETAIPLPPYMYFQSSTGCILDGDVTGGLLLCVPSGDTTGYYIGASALVAPSTSISWYAQNKIPTADLYSCGYYAGYIYCIGGFGETYYATASSGTVGTWHSGPTYPVGNIYALAPGCVANAGYIYCTGGDSGSDYQHPVAVSYYATIGPSGFGTWTSTTAYPIPLYATQCLAYNSYMYCFDGITTGVVGTNAVYAAPLSSSGIGGWQAGTVFPTSNFNEACAISGSNVICVGGISSTTTVEWAPLTTSPPYIGSWTVYPGVYPMQTWDFACQTFASTTYCFGGNMNSAVGTDTFDSLVFSTSDNGQTWQRETSLPYSDDLWGPGEVTSDGNYVYAIGGVWNEAWPLSVPDNYVYSSSGFNVPTVTLPLKVCVQESGAPSGIFTLAGGGVSPTTITSDCSPVDLTLDEGATLTVTAPTDGTSARYRMNSTSTSPTTENIVACSSGTCPTVTINAYYQVSNTYQASTNGNGPPAWDTGTSSLHQFVYVNGNAVAHYVPVTLANSQASATPTGFQEMITVNPSSYASYLASDLSNVNWQDGSGHILASWRENGTSSSNTRDVYWVNLGSNIIPASGGTFTVYLCFYGTSTSVLNTANTGEFPTATGTYGQYDDGVAVFTNYWNFAGTSLPSGWSAYGNDPTTVSNSVSIPAASVFNTGNGIDYNTKVPSTNILDYYITSGTLDPTGYYGGGYAIDQYGNPYTSTAGWICISGAAGCAYNALAPPPSSTSGRGFYSGVAGTAYNVATTTYALPAIVGVTIQSGLGIEYVNYVATTVSSHIPSPGDYYAAFGTGNSPSTFTMQWVRTRAYPPGNAMPSASFGTMGTGVVLSIPLTGTLSGAGGTGICSITPMLGTTTTAACSGWSDYGMAVTASSTASGAAANIQWTLYGASSYAPTTGGNTEAPFTYYKQLWNTYEATPGSPTTWDSVLSIPVTGTVGGTSGTTGCSIATSVGAGTAGCAAWFDYNAAVSMPATVADGSSMQWAGQAPVSFTQTNGGNANNVNYYKGGEISTSASTVDPGQTATLSIVIPPSGGATPYTCEWLVEAPGGTFGNLASSDCSSSHSTGVLSTLGTWSFELQVTDGNNAVVTSNTVTVTVIALSVSVSPVTVDSGQSATLTAVAAGGSGTYTTYAWYLGSSCSGTPLQTGTSTSYVTGALTTTTVYCAQVTDSFGGTAVTTATVTVNPVLTVTITPSAPTINGGQSVTLTANPSGGSGGYSYQWYQGATCSGTVLGTSASYTTPALTSSTTYCVKATDSLGSTASRTVTVTVIITSWTSFSMPASDEYSCVYYSGYVYCQGMTHSYYASVTIAGPGTWNAGPTYPIALGGGPACVQASGYMTCVGGSLSSGAVYRSALTSSGFGGWTSTTAYPTNIQADSCVQYSGYIYCVAGYVTSAVTSSSYYATLTNGAVGSWTSTRAYPVAIDQLACFVSVASSTSYMVCTGGYPTGSLNGITTYYATLSSSGIGPWSSGTVPNNAPSYPVWSIADVGCAGNTTVTFCVGGGNGASPTVPMVTYATDPTVGWETATHLLPTSVMFWSPDGCVLDNDLAGGLLLCVPLLSTSPSLVSTGYFIGASALVVTPTSLSWSPQNKIPTADGYSCAYYSGRIYCVGAGGQTYYATASSGTVGAWTSGPVYPVSNTYGLPPNCVGNAGYIYCTGGGTSYSNIVAVSYYATIGPSGFGAWTSTTAYPIPITAAPCLVYNSYMYCFAGFTLPYITETNAVYVAALSSSGIGTWQAATNFPVTVLNTACAVSGSNVICVGGFTGSGDISQTEWAPLTTSPPYVGSWTSYPGAYPIALHDSNCLTFAPRTYCIGGDIETPDNSVDTMMSRVFSTADNGHTWQEETPLPYTEDDWPSGMATSDGNYIYMIGGWQNEGWPNAIPTNYVYSSSGFNVPTVTLPLKVCLRESGAPSGTFTLAGGSVSPTTITSDCSPVNLTVNAGATVTVRVPSDGTYSRYRMDPTDPTYASPTTEIVVACSSGTCGTVTIDSFYQLSNTWPASTNGNGPPAWDAGSSQQFVTVSGNPIAYYVAVTLTNGQASATPSGFQEMITVNPSSYASYLASDLSNVNWQDGSGNILASWRESGTSSAGASAIYWVNLGSNIIPAKVGSTSGTLTIYLCFYGASVNALNTANTGEFPTATVTYGQYDDGANVFPVYNNFVGSSVPSGWTTLGTGVSFNNGVSITGSSSPYPVMYYNSLVPSTNILDYYVISGYSNPGGYWGGGYMKDLSGNPYTLTTGWFSVGSTAGWAYNALVPPPATTTGADCGFWSAVSGAATQLACTHYSLPAIVGVTIQSGLGVEYMNYAATTASTHIPATGNYYAEFGAGSPSSYFTMQWVRTRAYPPSNVMPSASFGGVTPNPLLGIALTGTLAGAGSTNICTINPTPGTTTTATCTGWSDYSAAVTAPSLASGAATYVQWKLYGASSYTPTTGGGTITPFTYYRQLQNTYRATPAAPTTWDTVLSIPVTGTLGGTPSSLGCSITTAGGGGGAGCTSFFDYNTAVSLAASVADGSGTQWAGQAPLGFTQTTGGNTNNVNYNMQYQATFAQSGLDSSATGTVVTVNSTPETYSALPYSVWVNSGGSVTFSWTNPVTSGTSGERFSFLSSSQTSPYTVSGPVTITGTYLAQYQVTFAASPPSYGSVSPTGTSVWENSGALPIAATPNPGYEFVQWTATGSITFANSASASTTATIAGTGTITAAFSTLPSVSALASPSTIDSGQTSTLTATPSGGTGPYTYAWYEGGSCSGTVLGTSASYTTATLSSTTTYCVKVTDSLLGTATTTVTVTVNVALSVSVPTPAAIDSGQSTTLTASPSGGSGGYTYAWYLGGTCSGSVLGTSASYTTGALTSTTTYCVMVTDSLSSTATTTVTVTVNSVLSVSVSPVTIDYGTSTTLTASPSGGSGGYSYAWYQGATCTGTVLGTSASYTTTTLTSTTTYCVKVSDSVGSTATTTVTVTVNSVLSVSVSPVTIYSGQTATLTASPSGGSGGYSYAWYLGATCTGTPLQSGASASYTTAALTSTTTYCVVVTDSLSGTATTTVTVTVSMATTLTPSSGYVGSSVTISGSGFVASHSLTVTYDGSSAGMPTTCTTDSSGAVNSGCAFTVPGSASGPHTVTVSDGTNSPTATFTVNMPPLDESFTLAAPLAKVLLGPFETVQATWTNNIPSDVVAQVTGIVWFEVENSAGQTVTILATSLTLQSGASDSAYLGLSTLPPGTYTVEVFVTTTSGIPISQAEYLTTTV